MRGTGMTYAMPDDERTDPAFTLGDRLRKARERAGISGKQMGQLLAEFNDGKPYSHSTISAWERDLNQPRHFLDIVIRWAEITRVTEVWLLEGAGLTLWRQLAIVADSGQQEMYLPDPSDRGGARTELQLV